MAQRRGFGTRHFSIPQEAARADGIMPSVMSNLSSPSVKAEYALEIAVRSRGTTTESAAA